MDVTLHVPWLLTQKLFWQGFGSAFAVMAVVGLIVYIGIGLSVFGRHES